MIINQNKGQNNNYLMKEIFSCRMPRKLNAKCVEIVFLSQYKRLN